MQKKVIICDIDGTLAYSDTEVSDKILEIIQMLQEKYFFVTMGNGSYTHLYNQFIKRYLKKIGKEIYVFLLGELECYKISKQVVIKIYSNELSNKEKYKVVKTISDFIKKYKIKPDTYDQIEDRGSMVVFSVLGGKADKNLKKNYDPNGFKRRKFIKEFFKDRLPEFKMKVGGTTTIDFTRIGLTKGFGIQKIKEMLDYNFNDMVYFGDDLKKGGNDYAVKEFIEAIKVKNPEHTFKELKKYL